MVCTCCVLARRAKEEETQESSADVSEGRAAIVVSGCGGREEVVGTTLIWWKLSLGVRMQTVTVSPPRLRKRVGVHEVELSTDTVTESLCWYDHVHTRETRATCRVVLVCMFVSSIDNVM